MVQATSAGRLPPDDDPSSGNRSGPSQSNRLGLSRRELRPELTQFHLEPLRGWGRPDLLNGLPAGAGRATRFLEFRGRAKKASSPERDTDSKVARLGPVNRWGVPAAVLVSVVAGVWVAVSGVFAATNGSFDYNNELFDPRVRLFLFAVPLAAAVAAPLAYFSVGRLGRVLAPVRGALGGLVAALVLGLQYLALPSGWIAAVPSDSNRASRLLVLWVVGVTSIPLVLSATALLGPTPRLRRRNRILGLALLSASMGGLIGIFVGATAGALVAAGQTSYYPDVAGAIESGAFDGILLGPLVGLNVGGLLAFLAVRAYTLAAPVANRPG